MNTLNIVYDKATKRYDVQIVDEEKTVIDSVETSGDIQSIISFLMTKNGMSVQVVETPQYKVPINMFLQLNFHQAEVTPKGKVFYRPNAGLNIAYGPDEKDVDRIEIDVTNGSALLYLKDEEEGHDLGEDNQFILK